jgi:hypothetical protein
MRRSTNVRCGDVRTIVDVGSDASPGSHRIDLRIEMLPIVYAIVGMRRWIESVQALRVEESQLRAPAETGPVSVHHFFKEVTLEPGVCAPSPRITITMVEICNIYLLNYYDNIKTIR